MLIKTYHLGLDLGGTKFSGVLLDGNGHDIVYREVPVRRTWTPKNLTHLLQSLANDIVERAGIMPKKLKTIGIGVPGIVDDKGDIKKVINLSALEHVNVRKIIPGVPVSVYNDAVCACYAEATLGELTRSTTGIHLMLGTGLGSAAAFRYGEKNMMGNRTMLQISNLEMGHITADINNVVNGSSTDEPYELEDFCSRKFFSRETDLSLRELYREYLEGDHGSQQLFARFGAHIGSLLATVETLYRPDTIVLGGGLTAYYKAYKGVMDNVYHSRRFLTDKPAPVRLSAFGKEVGAIGAALYGMTGSQKRG